MKDPLPRFLLPTVNTKKEIEKNVQQDQDHSTTLKNLENERQVTKWHFWDKKAAFLKKPGQTKLNLMLRRNTSVQLEPGLRYQENSSYAALRRGKSMSLIELYSHCVESLCQLHAQGKKNEFNG